MPSTPNSSTVTIGMPVYNGEAGLEQSLNSLLNQSHRDLRLVIHDNASTDETREICKHFVQLDDRVSLRLNKSNIGPVANFTQALSEAETSFFMWAAHDDTWHPQFVEKCLAALKATSDAGFAMPLYVLRSTRWKVTRKCKAESLRYITSKNRNERILSYINMCASSHKCNMVYSLFRADILKKAYSRHDISNDGLLAALILDEARWSKSPYFSRTTKTCGPPADAEADCGSKRPRISSICAIKPTQGIRPSSLIFQIPSK